MRAQPRHRFARAICLAAVAVLHLLLWLLRPGTDATHGGRAPDETTAQVIFILSEPAIVTAIAAPATARSQAPRAMAKQPSAASGAITQPARSAADRTDWYADVEQVARDVAPDVAMRACPHGTRLAKSGTSCERDRQRFEWKAEDKRAGFSGGLPYVRIGRCVVVLGFVGCPLGAAPEANSHLFDGMQDPDRDRSSVPDITELRPAH